LSPIRLCLEPRCPNPATGRGRCDEHRKPIERERSRRCREATNGVYKRRKWELTRRAVLARDPICKVCNETLSTEVDHIVPREDGGADYDMDALQGSVSTVTSPRPRARTRQGPGGRSKRERASPKDAPGDSARKNRDFSLGGAGFSEEPLPLPAIYSRPHDFEGLSATQ
jgi:5-methylcytosine-specific restriction endonuclease McrA